MTDLRAMLAKAETLLASASEAQRRPFVALFVLFNTLVLPQTPMPSLQEVVERHGAVLEKPSLEGMLVHILLGTLPDWTLEEHQAAHDRYLSTQGKANSLRVPPVLRGGLSLALAERYRASGDEQGARRLVCAAVENHPGDESTSQLEATFDPETQIPWRLDIPKLHPTDNPDPDRLSGGRVIMESDISVDL